MTRRDYVLLSEAARQRMMTLTDPAHRRGAAMMTRAIADALAAQSTGFDRDRFIKDAGCHYTGDVAP